MRVGGQVPDSYGLSLTVNVPGASKETPVAAGSALTWDNGGPYQAALAADGADVELVAKHTVTSAREPLGVYVYGFSRVDRLSYTGTAPVIGNSVVAAGDGTVRDAGVDAGGAPIANGTRVLFVDTANSTVEVAL